MFFALILFVGVVALYCYAGVLAIRYTRKRAWRHSNIRRECSVAAVTAVFFAPCGMIISAEGFGGMGLGPPLMAAFMDVGFGLPATEIIKFVVLPYLGSLGVFLGIQLALKSGEQPPAA